jgi:aryl-alcohol dehydrogenase-like predicted oxidoreductase
MEAALQATGASLVPSATLAGGALSGKYAERSPSPSARLSAELSEPRRARELALGAALREPARQLDTTPATLAVAFTLLHPWTASTLIGATAPVQIDAAVDAVSLAGRLTADDVARLRALAAGVR